MSRLRRRVGIAAAVVAVLLCVAAIARILIRQTRGPIRENLARAGRHADYSGTRTEPITGLIEANGIIEPTTPEMRLATDIPGRISAIYVKEGDQVAARDLLAEIDNTVQRAQVARAEADIAAAGAELQRVVHGMRAQDVNAVASEAVAAKARAALAESDYARTQELVGKGSLAAAELDHAKQRSEAEAAAARAASERARGASAGSRHEDVLIAQARLKAATAALEEARGALARTQIIAPKPGRILRLKLHVGEYHNPTTDPLIILGDVSKLRVRIDVDERDVARLKVGIPAYVTATAFGTERFPGKVVEVSHRMGRRSIRVDDPKDRVDVKVLEAVLELDESPPFLVGLRVSAFVGAK